MIENLQNRYTRFESNPTLSIKALRYTRLHVGSLNRHASLRPEHNTILSIGPARHSPRRYSQSIRSDARGISRSFRYIPFLSIESHHWASPRLSQSLHNAPPHITSRRFSQSPHYATPRISQSDQIVPLRVGSDLSIVPHHLGALRFSQSDHVRSRSCTSRQYSQSPRLSPHQLGPLHFSQSSRLAANRFVSLDQIESNRCSFLSIVARQTVAPGNTTSHFSQSLHLVPLHSSQSHRLIAFHFSRSDQFGTVRSKTELSDGPCQRNTRRASSLDRYSAFRLDTLNRGGSSHHAPGRFSQSVRIKGAPSRSSQSSRYSALRSTTLSRSDAYRRSSPLSIGPGHGAAYLSITTVRFMSILSIGPDHIISRRISRSLRLFSCRGTFASLLSIDKTIDIVDNTFLALWAFGMDFLRRLIPKNMSALPTLEREQPVHELLTLLLTSSGFSHQALRVLAVPREVWNTE